MFNLEWKIELETACGKMTYEGKNEPESGKIRVFLDLPDSTVLSISGDIEIHLEKHTHIFMNGFQSWTHCPEFSSTDKILGAYHLPNAIIKKFGIDRYGDYYFTDYPEKKGIIHGESYCYFRNGETFKLFGSLSEELGYTQFSYDANSNTLHIERDCKGLKLHGGTRIFDLFYKEGNENEVFDSWFKEMNIKVSDSASKKMAGYSSWYNRYQKISENTILEDLEGCKECLHAGDLFQIDDGWEPFVGDWLEPDKKKFPTDMKTTVDEIHNSGFKAGLWLAPFVAQKNSKIYKEHQDWFLKIDGEPWYCGSNWGGFYSLDIDNPEVVLYLKSVFSTVFDVWNFDLVKLDFLYAVAPHNTGFESRAARMIRGMDMLRSFCGENLILGCGVPLMPAFGRVDYCRIGPDVGLSWNDNPIMKKTNREHVSTTHSIENSIFRRELNGRAFGNDPDVFFLRDNNIKLSDAEKEKVYVVNALFGNVLFMSDNPSKYSSKAKDLYPKVRALATSKDTNPKIEHTRNGNKVKIIYTDPEDGKEKSINL